MKSTLFRILLKTALVAALVTTAVVEAASPARPNFLIILADDMGFSDAGCYGGEIATPNLDELAAGGLRYTSFYNTARCWPTRAALLTGYYAQQVRMDPPMARTNGLPGWAQLLPQRLKPLGYRSYHSGKWHVFGANRPVADAGFDRAYKLDDFDRYFAPRLHVEDDRPLSAARSWENYYATTAIADHAIRCLKEHAEQHGQQPFFQYLAFNAPHFPLHAPEEDIARYRDRYLEGWDAMREQRWKRLRAMGIAKGRMAPAEPDFSVRYFKPDWLEQLGPGEVERAVPWESLTQEQKRFQATKMAIHAAMVDRMDREIGRVLGQLRAMDAYDNTVILFLSDNGADASILIRGDGHDPAASPGSGESYLCLGPGWSTASNTPFRRHKIWTHEGGISTPLIVHWPEGIRSRGELRRAVGHVIDVVPTMLELAGGKTPVHWEGEDVPVLPGRSLVPTFAKDRPIKREFLFFHHEGNRALRVGDWKLVSAREDDNRWELYDLGKDRSETANLAHRHPRRVTEMAAQWEALEANFRLQATPR